MFRVAEAADGTSARQQILVDFHLVVVLLLACTACDGRVAVGGASSRQSPATVPSLDSTAWQVSPDSLTATLHLADGRTLEFTSDTGEQYDRPVRNRYIGTLPVLGYHVIEQDYYEGWNYLLVHPSTGHTTTVWKPPIVSPSGRRLLVASMDLDAGYVPTLVQIWTVRSDSLTRDWELTTADYEAGEGWGASDPQWLSDTVVRVMKHPFHDGRLSADSAPAWIVRTPSGWQVQGRLP